MCILRNSLTRLLLSILLLVSTGVFAQEEKLIRAQQLFFKEKKTDEARLAIDSVVRDPKTRLDYVSWTTRAFIYYEIYKRGDKLKLYSPYRDTIVASLKISSSLKPDSSYASSNKKLMAVLAASYHSLAKSYLQDSLNADKSQYAYKKFRELYLISEPGANLGAKDIEYNLAVGSQFSEQFIRDNKDVKSQENAKVALMKVLELQPDNPSANMNLGLMYYNQAVNMIKEAAYDEDIEKIDILQENAVKLARQAEQFIIRVYNNDKKHAKAATALYYIYRMLLDFKKSDEFKKKAEELGVKFDEQGGTAGETQTKDNQNKQN